MNLETGATAVPREETFVFYNETENKLCFITYNKELKSYVVEEELGNTKVTTVMSLDSIMARRTASGLIWDTLGIL